MTLFDATPPGPPPNPVRVRMTVAYDGTGFRGFAAHDGVKTVAGALEAALAKVLGHPVRLTCAGRTDAGVHAWGQVVSFDADADRFDAASVQRALIRMLGPAIVIRDAGVAAPDFDARKSAMARSYRYTVVNRPVPDPFLAATAWHVEDPLEMPALRLACDPIIGEHDFSSFCRAPKGNGAADATLVRRVLDAAWLDLGDGVLRFDITGNAFCQQMVRSLVGTMVEMGRGKRRAGEMAAILRARDRRYASQPAPPHGLCLWSVAYC